MKLAFCAVMFVALTTLARAEKAIAVLHSASGSKVTGTVTFTKTDEGVRVVADVEGLEPGEHGFHIHEFGDCSAADATSAGGHFNPGKHQHAGPDAAERHEGDLGNIAARNARKAHYERVDKELKLDGPDSIIGKSVIVHEKVDDEKTQPTGNAGARVACGVIGVAKD
jgi:superoxide dismutase, Cu-Zn family